MSVFKAVICDIDGTLTPIIPNALPTRKVNNAVKEAINQGIAFSVASGRPYSLIEYLLDYLELTAPTIADNGAVIVEADGGKVLWEMNLDNKVAKGLIALTKTVGFTRISTNMGILENPDKIPPLAKIRKVSVHDLEFKTAEELIKQIETKVGNVAVIKAASYKGENALDLYFSNKEATKQHAVEKYAKILGIKTSEIIGIGDGHNDLALLQACGLKVAMGNAVPELKYMADYIAPSVDDDGLVDILEKFVLN